jgi:anti-anti-sigma factor
MAFQLLRPRSEGAGDDVTVVHFTGRKVSLDEETLYHVRDQLVALAEEPGQRPLLVDFGNVDYISSTALGMLVNLHKQLLGAGRRLTVYNVRPQVYEVFAVTRLNCYLDLRPAAGGARASLPTGVLVGDDDPAVLAALSTGLRRKGFPVWLASHGQQAVALYRRHHEAIAAVLLDVLMPGLDGTHTLAALRKISPAVRCYFLTGDPNPYTEEALLHFGAAGVFRKPFTLAEVAQTLDRLSDRSSQGGEDRWIEFPVRGG